MDIYHSWRKADCQHISLIVILFVFLFHLSKFCLLLLLSFFTVWLSIYLSRSVSLLKLEFAINIVSYNCLDPDQGWPWMWAYLIFQRNEDQKNVCTKSNQKKSITLSEAELVNSSFHTWLCNWDKVPLNIFCCSLFLILVYWEKVTSFRLEQVYWLSRNFRSFVSIHRTML